MMTNKQLVALVLGYGLLNLVIMLAFGMSLLGPVPFGLIHAFRAVSGCLVIAGLLAAVIPHVRRGYLPSLVITIVTAGALIAFNTWCLFAASAAV